jgi:exopolyphosphatase/guanosine-5'-triphosphate,3'-diphosphate pyrophosphatase
MNPDRADVIVPAADIFIDLMGMISADHVLVPGVGLKEGLLYALYEHQTGESIRDIQFLGTF